MQNVCTKRRILRVLTQAKQRAKKHNYSVFVNFHDSLTSFRRLIDGNIAFHTDKSAGNKIIMHNIKGGESMACCTEEKKAGDFF